MSKNSERVKIWLGDDWFGALMWILQNLQQRLQSYIEAREADQDQEGAESYKQNLRDNIQLVNKIIKYGWYEEKADGHNEARVEFFASEARDLIWQLLLFSVLHIPENAGASLYEEYKAKHEEMKNASLPPLLTSSAAYRLYQETLFGYELLIKNKDGKVYLVDHGASGELIKTDSQWEDAEYGFDENIFVPTNLGSKLVSWEDEQPLDISEYLQENGWIKDGEFIKKRNKMEA